MSTHGIRGVRPTGEGRWRAASVPLPSLWQFGLKLFLSYRKCTFPPAQLTSVSLRRTSLPPRPLQPRPPSALVLSGPHQAPRPPVAHSGSSRDGRAQQPCAPGALCREAANRSAGLGSCQTWDAHAELVSGRQLPRACCPGHRI